MPFHKACYYGVRTVLMLSAPFATTGPSHAADTIPEALVQSETDLSLRYRYELVDQDGFDNNANASTLKTRLTYTSAQWRHISTQL